MTNQRSLQIGLQERYRTLAKAEYRYFAERAAYLRNYVVEHAALAAIVRSLDDLAPELDPAEWVRAHSVDRVGIDLPPTEAGCAPAGRVGAMWLSSVVCLAGKVRVSGIQR